MFVITNTLKKVMATLTLAVMLTGFIAPMHAVAASDPTLGSIAVTVTPETGTYDILRADGSKMSANPFVGSQTFNGLPQSTLTVVFLPIAGHVAPTASDNKTVIVSPGATASTSYTYTENTPAPVNGTLSVTVNQPAGHYTVSDASGAPVTGSPFTGNKDLTLPQSSYTVTFLPIAGYDAPKASDSKTVLVSPGLTTEVSYTYNASGSNPVNGTLKVTVTPSDKGQYKVLKADGNQIDNSPFTGSKDLTLPQSSYTVVFLPIVGYDAPKASDAKTVLVSPGLTTEVNYTYVHSTQPSNTIAVNLFDQNHNPVTNGQWVLKTCTDSSSISSCTTDFKSGTASLSPTPASPGIYGIFASKGAYLGVAVLSANPQNLTAGGALVFNIQYTSNSSTNSTATLSISANVASAPVFVDDFATTIGNATPTVPVTKDVSITADHTIRCGTVAGYTSPADIAIPANTLQKGETKVYSCTYALTTLLSVTKVAAEFATANNNKLISYTVTVTNLVDQTVSFKLSDTISANGGRILASGGELAVVPNTCKVDGVIASDCLDLKTIDLALDSKNKTHVVTYDMRSNNAAQTAAAAFANTVTATYTNPNTQKEESVSATKSVLVDIPTPVVIPGSSSGGGGSSSGVGGGHTMVKGDMNLIFKKTVSLDGNSFRDAMDPSQAIAIPESQTTRVYTKLTITNPANVSVANLRLIPIFESGKSDMTAEKIQNLNGATLDNQGRILIERITAQESVSLSYDVLVHENGKNSNPALEGMLVAEIGSTLPITQDGLTYKNLGQKVATTLYAGTVPALPKAPATDYTANFSNDSGLLSIRVNSDKSQVAIGDVVNYTLTLTNVSDQDLTNLSLMQDIPAELSVLNSGGGINGGDQLTWMTAILRPGEQMTRHFQVKVASGTPGTQIRSLTSVLMSEGEVDPVDSTLMILGAPAPVHAYRLAQTGPGGILALLILSILSALAFNAYGKRRNMKIREMALRPL